MSGRRQGVLNRPFIIVDRVAHGVSLRVSKKNNCSFAGAMVPPP